MSGDARPFSAACRIFEGFAVEPAPPQWIEALPPLHDLLNASLSDSEPNLRAAALDEVARLIGLNESIHGYPDPITCPADVTRKSIALYYYTVEQQPVVPRSTNYRARPGDGARAALIWLDNKLLAGYSKVKRALGLSDNFASTRDFDGRTRIAW